MNKPVFKCDLDKKYWITFSSNTSKEAILYLEQNPDKIHWHVLSANPSAIHILEKNPVNIYWAPLSSNPSAIHLLEANPVDVHWNDFYANPNPKAIQWIEKNIEREKYNNLNGIDWIWLSMNPGAIHILEQNKNRIVWDILSLNPSPGAVRLLEQNPELIDWDNISANPSAIHLIEKTLDKIHWGFLSRNPNAMHLLEKNPDKINWLFLAKNPSAVHLFLKYDYQKMKENWDPLFKEVTEYVFDPKRLQRFAERYDIEFIDLVEIYNPY